MTFTGNYSQDGIRYQISGKLRVSEDGKLRGDIRDHNNPSQKRTLEGKLDSRSGKLVFQVNVPDDNTFNVLYELTQCKDGYSYTGIWTPLAKKEEMRVLGGPHDSKIGGPDFYDIIMLGEMKPTEEQLRPEPATILLKAA